jgi:hypothetical protein
MQDEKRHSGDKPEAKDGNQNHPGDKSEELVRVGLRERIAAIAAELAKYPETGLEADKPFFDELSGD